MIASPHPVTVLLADDDMDDIFLFKDALSEILDNLVIISVANGLEVMETLAKHSLPDLVFLDINMPLKGGLECLEEIRNTERLRKLKVIMVSTAKSKSLINLAYTKGADLYINKGGDYAEFKSLLNEVFSVNNHH